MSLSFFFFFFFFFFFIIIHTVTFVQWRLQQNLKKYTYYNKTLFNTNVYTQSKYRFQTEIQQMMFVFGEVSDPLQETTMLVEDIVRSQVIEIVIFSFYVMNLYINHVLDYTSSSTSQSQEFKVPECRGHSFFNTTRSCQGQSTTFISKLERCPKECKGCIRRTSRRCCRRDKYG